MAKLDFLTGKFIEDKPKKRKSPEAAVGRVVDDYLHTLGGYVRQITSAGTLRNGRYTRGGQGAGISDRLCWLPDGKFIAIELKAAGKKRTVTEAQHSFLSKIIGRGHHGCVADCVGDIERCLSQSASEMQATLDTLMIKIRCHRSSEPLFP